MPYLLPLLPLKKFFLPNILALFPYQKPIFAFQTSKIIAVSLRTKTFCYEKIGWKWLNFNFSTNLIELAHPNSTYFCHLCFYVYVSSKLFYEVFLSTSYQHFLPYIYHSALTSQQLKALKMNMTKINFFPSTLPQINLEKMSNINQNTFYEPHYTDKV